MKLRWDGQTAGMQALPEHVYTPVRSGSYTAALVTLCICCLHLGLTWVHPCAKITSVFCVKKKKINSKQVLIAKYSP